MKIYINVFILKCNKIEFLIKVFKLLFEKYHGLVDIEERYRRRWVDLIINEELKNKFILRIKIIKWIKEYFDNLDYLEVEIFFL